MDQVMTAVLPATEAEYTTSSDHEYRRRFFSSPIDPRRESDRKDIASNQMMLAQLGFLGRNSMSSRIVTFLLAGLTVGGLAVSGLAVSGLAVSGSASAPAFAQSETVMVGGAAMFPSKNIIKTQ
jgi:hypothetical protein